MASPRPEPFFLVRKVELEDLVPFRLGYAGAVSATVSKRIPRTKFDVKRERTAFRHRIESVDSEVHECLPQQVGIAPERNALRPGTEVHGDGTKGGIGLNQRGDIACDFGEVEFLLRHFDWVCEVEEGSDDAVEALDFFADDLDLLRRFGRISPTMDSSKATRAAIELSGFLTSCATPPVNRLMASRRASSPI